MMKAAISFFLTLLVAGCGSSSIENKSTDWIQYENPAECDDTIVIDQVGPRDFQRIDKDNLCTSGNINVVIYNVSKMDFKCPEYYLTFYFSILVQGMNERMAKLAPGQCCMDFATCKKCKSAVMERYSIEMSGDSMKFSISISEATRTPNMMHGEHVVKLLWGGGRIAELKEPVTMIYK